MTKAQEKAMEAYLSGEIRNRSRIYCYEAGYKQASKDITLTWEDIKTIEGFLFELSADGYTVKEKRFYNMVLKRFLKSKE